MPRGSRGMPPRGSRGTMPRGSRGMPRASRAAARSAALCAFHPVLPWIGLSMGFSFSQYSSLSQRSSSKICMAGTSGVATMRVLRSGAGRTGIHDVTRAAESMLLLPASGDGNVAPVASRCGAADGGRFLFARRDGGVRHRSARRRLGRASELDARGEDLQKGALFHNGRNLINRHTTTIFSLFITY